jgi:hypothetical protein
VPERTGNRLRGRAPQGSAKAEITCAGCRRAKAIAVIYGSLIGDGSEPCTLFLGYLLGAAVRIVGGIVAAVLGVAAEGKLLEDIATPLSARRPGARAEGSARPRV